MENTNYDKRDLKFIKFLSIIYGPCLKYYFGLHFKGVENLNLDENFILISNHNIGAIIESQGLLFFFQKHFPKKRIFGFTHPSLFKIPIISSYWKKIGAVPSTYEMAANILRNGDHLLIFPGGNRQATRSLWNYKKNSSPWTSL